MSKAFASVLFIPLIGLIVLTSAWVGVKMRLDSEKKEAIESAQMRAEVLADALVQHTAKTIHDIDIIALLVKHEFEADPAGFRLSSLRRAGLIRPDSAAQVSVVDRTGRISQSTVLYAGGVYVTDREHFKVHVRPDVHGLFLSKPVRGRVSGKWTIQLTRRLETKDGKFAGVVVVSEDGGYLTHGFAIPAALGPNGAVSIDTHDGIKITDEPAVTGVSSVTSNTSPHAWYRTAESTSGAVSAHRIVPGYPLKVSVSLPNSDVLRPYFEMRRVYLASSVLLSMFFAIFLTVVVILFRRLLKSREELRVLSQTDTLTGLWNRHGMLRQLRAALKGRTILRRLAVVFIDFGNLKRVNDTLGHDAGDQLLKKMAFRMAQILEPHVVGRFGGDEFLAIVKSNKPDADVSSLVEQVVDRLRALFESPVSLRGNVFNVRASIGVAVHSRSDDDVWSLIREANEAMYAAKERMSRTHATEHCIYSAAMREDARRAIDAEQTWRAAMDKRQLALRFVPVRDARDGRLCGFRVAVGIEGQKEPASVTRSALPLNVENGLAGTVTEFVLFQIFVQLRDWLTVADTAFVRLSYPLSETQFLGVDCASMISDLSLEFGLSPGSLELELPERAFVEEPALAHERAVALHNVGARLVLGGFSGSFDAFGYLANNPLDGVVFRPSVEATDIVVATGRTLLMSGRLVALEGDWAPNIDEPLIEPCRYRQISDIGIPLDASIAREMMLDDHRRRQNESDLMA